MDIAPTSQGIPSLAAPILNLAGSGVEGATFANQLQPLLASPPLLQATGSIAAISPVVAGQLQVPAELNAPTTCQVPLRSAVGEPVLPGSTTASTAGVSGQPAAEVTSAEPATEPAFQTAEKPQKPIKRSVGAPKSEVQPPALQERGDVSILLPEGLTSTGCLASTISTPKRLSQLVSLIETEDRGDGGSTSLVTSELAPPIYASNTHTPLSLGTLVSIARRADPHGEAEQAGSPELELGLHPRFKVEASAPAAASLASEPASPKAEPIPQSSVAEPPSEFRADLPAPKAPVITNAAAAPVQYTHDAPAEAAQHSSHGARVLRFNEERVGQQFGVEIARKVSEGGEELVIRLEPAELGRVAIRMRFDDQGSLRAIVSAESAMVMDAMRRDTGELTRTLSDAGVRTDSQSFRFDRNGMDGGQGGSAWQRFEQRSSPSEVGSHEVHNDLSEASQATSGRIGRIDLMA